MAETTAEPKLFGRYNQVVLLLLGFILTTLVGGYLSDRYESRRVESERAATIEEKRLVRSAAFVEEISSLMDRRLFRLRNVAWTLRNSTKVEELEEARAEYREAVAQWNENLNRNLIFLEHYFGRDVRDKFSGTIHTEFRELHKELVATLAVSDAARNGAVTDLESKINAFNPSVYSFNLGLLDLIDGRGGSRGDDRAD